MLLYLEKWRINLTFWDELAHVAFQHVEKGQQIYVSGRLVSDTVENDEGKQQTYYKVVVQQLNFVERSFSSADESNSLAAGNSFLKLGSPATNSTGSIEELWQAFFANPVDWWDNRKTKKNPKYPDFKHKDTGEALWVEGRYNPSWVKSQLAILDSRMESFRDQDARMHVNLMAGDDFMPF
ncbi:Protein OSB1, mitochondrial [Vitis vinifera]|uniref:Protein OSB1, mitochondrial n=1 Tax=Vitis vinifera TaxID=29760 RepID=A0A438KHR1_VITVI|nr:Protein OSB1, mitochondrial [Vitis vinifera]